MADIFQKHVMPRLNAKAVGALACASRPLAALVEGCSEELWQSIARSMLGAQHPMDACAYAHTYIAYMCTLVNYTSLICQLCDLRQRQGPSYGAQTTLALHSRALKHSSQMLPKPIPNQSQKHTYFGNVHRLPMESQRFTSGNLLG